MPWPLETLRLRVRDLDAQLAFYRDRLGLEVLGTDGSLTRLAPGGGRFTLELLHDPEAPLRAHPTLGLFHFALLLPDRPALASVLQRLVESDYPDWEGASDHGVSEALYLSDPEGNGIELYRDRPREEWPRRGSSVAMATDRLDVKSLLADAPGASPLHEETRLGHLHLHVPDLDDAEAFFTRVAGMVVTQRDYPGARFLSRDGYHHHMGNNNWAGRRAAPDGATGLVGYSWTLPADAVPDSGVSDVIDPVGHVVELRA